MKLQQQNFFRAAETDPIDDDAWRTDLQSPRQRFFLYNFEI